MPKQSRLKAILEAKCPDFYYCVVGIPSMVLIFLPVMFRYSCVHFLYLFWGIKYDMRDRTII